jgi:hypothetical protein
LFSQVNDVEVKLDYLVVEFDEHKDEAYKVNFDIISFSKTYHSNMTSAKVAKIKKD